MQEKEYAARRRREMERAFKATDDSYARQLVSQQPQKVCDGNLHTLAGDVD